ncbi:UNVERIFIED_CONTAM: Transposon Ty3-G Gag-Pol polyprotein [Sesamum radiatum]|uniref:Transposon Ty3-G Gag-Pol polyprotein n=1 Tax=Sesamum radiatum TaxID=300843 RepID=A0AAW2TI15_SESRA
MCGINPEIMVHRLSVDPSMRPVNQKKRVFGSERTRAIKEEVEKLLKINYIRPVQYPEWLANVVIVPKANGKWRMCVDFSDLNKACPKDSYPLPRIDALIDSTSGCELISFLDAFQGYNQNRLADEDQEKTNFVIDQGIFCYNVMPFGLKNAGATYQRLVNNMFQEQIGKNMEVYIDDMLVKSKRKEDHPRDLQACFGILQRFGMKLNPAKCTFGIHGGKSWDS